MASRQVITRLMFHGVLVALAIGCTPVAGDGGSDGDPGDAITADGHAPDVETRGSDGSPDSAPAPVDATLPDTAPADMAAPDAALDDTGPADAAVDDTGPADARPADMLLVDMGPAVVCGDGVCADPETCADCPDDCGCGPSERCDAGACVLDCPEDCGALLDAACDPDGRAYRLCVPDPERPGCLAPGARIACGEDRSCEGPGEGCAGFCAAPELIFVVDRSSSMAREGKWDATVEAIEDFVGVWAPRIRIGLRTFPDSQIECAAGRIQAPEFGPRLFLGEPAGFGDTPIAAALDGLSRAYGDPDEGEMVILVTDGEETCADEAAVIAATEALRLRGVNVFAVGIGPDANRALLGRIAEAGGTAVPGPFFAEDRDGLYGAFSDIRRTFDVCVCNPGFVFCRDGELLECAEHGLGFDLLEPCAFGCADGTACYPECTPGAPLDVCDAHYMTVCGDDGRIERDGSCFFGCEANACLEGPTVDRCVFAERDRATAWAAGEWVNDNRVAVFEEGFTTLTPGVDTAERYEVQIGHGPLGSDPRVEQWFWQDLRPVARWDDADHPGLAGYDGFGPSNLGANVPPGGRHSFGFRVRIPRSEWTYCDTDDRDGFQPEQLGFFRSLGQPHCSSQLREETCFASRQGRCSVDEVNPTRETARICGRGCDEDRCRAPLRGRLVVCGARTPALDALLDEGGAGQLEIVDGCSLDLTTAVLPHPARAVLVLPGGRLEGDSEAWRRAIGAGLRVVALGPDAVVHAVTFTEMAGADEIDAEARFGECGASVMPAFQLSHSAPLWSEVDFEPAPEVSDCGPDLSPLTDMRRLGGWERDRISLGYITRFQGEIWLMSPDVVAGLAERTPREKALLSWFVNGGLVPPAAAPGEPVLLDPALGYGAEPCGGPSPCDTPRACADMACAQAGHGPALGWQAADCLALDADPARTCMVLDEARERVRPAAEADLPAGCALPGATAVTCAPTEGCTHDDDCPDDRFCDVFGVCSPT